MGLTAMLSGLARPAAADDEMYKPTEPGRVEVKTLPAMRAISTEGEKGDYFNGGNGLFMRLFRYIRAHDIPMTTPVEADVKVNRMRFFIGKDLAKKDFPDEKSVVVTVRPERTVVSAGIRGSYDRENFDAGKADIEKWLKAHPEWKADGDVYGAYWNSPLVPWFLRKSEVHQPVVKTEAAPAEPNADPPAGAGL